MYYVEYKTRRRFRWRQFPEFKRVDNNDHLYFAKFQTKEEAKQYVWKGRFYGYKAYWFDEKWNRRYGLRKKWLKTHPPDADGLYRCVYCGRRVTPNGITVDHIIPVQAAKESKFLQWQLARKGYTGINDDRNLVPACFECNRRKGRANKLKWHLRAKMGKSNVFWYLVWTLMALLIIIGILIVYIQIKKVGIIN